MPLTAAVAGLIGAGLGAGTSIGGSIYQNIQGKKLQEYQNEYNEEQIKKQNAYNSPANQMRLLKDAGLNPNAITSGNTLGGAIQNQANESADRKTPDWSVTGQSIANLAADSALKIAQAKNLNVQSDIQGKKFGLEQQKFDFSKDIQTQYFSLASSENVAKIGLYGANAEQARANAALMDEKVWDMSFYRQRSIINDERNWRAVSQQMNIAWASESRARMMFPDTWRYLKSGIHLRDAQAFQAFQLGSKFAMETRILGEENFNNFVDGIDDWNTISPAQKRGILNLTLLGQSIALESAKTTTEYKRAALLDQKIPFIQKMCTSLDLKNSILDKDNKTYYWRFANEQITSYSHMLNERRNTFFNGVNTFKPFGGSNYQPQQHRDIFTNYEYKGNKWTPKGRSVHDYMK